MFTHLQDPESTGRKLSKQTPRQINQTSMQTGLSDQPASWPVMSALLPRITRLAGFSGAGDRDIPEVAFLGADPAN